jgi:nitroreductase
MELKEVMLKRRSVRKFTNELVSDEQIDILLHYAMSGPSACNKQPWEFFVVTNEEKLKEL